MRLETFQAMLNPSDTHKDVAIKTGFDAFIDSLKYFFSTGKIEDFGEKAREKQFTRIMSNIKTNLNTTKTGSNDTTVLYENQKNKIKIEQQGLTIFAVSINQKGETTPNFKMELKTFKGIDEMQGFINAYPLISTANGNHDSHKLLLSIRYEGQAFLPNLDKIAQAHFDNVPDEDLDLVEEEQRGEYDDSKRAQTLAHLLRSQPVLLGALREHHLTNTVEAADVLDAVHPGHNGKSGFTLLISVITAAQLADDDNAQNRPLITRASQSPAPSTSAVNHHLLPMS